jgi:integrase
MNYLKIDTYSKLLDKDPKIIHMDICDFISFMRKDRSYAMVSLYVAAINKFYAMNDIILNMKKIRAFMGEHEKIAEDRPYTHLEISKLLGATSYRNRAIILLMASAGLRRGAVPPLRIKDLEPIDRHSIYKIIVYARTRQNYFTFCTPECRKAIDDYLEYRRRWGERITDDSPLFGVDFNSIKITKVEPAMRRSRKELR